MNDLHDRLIREMLEKEPSLLTSLALKFGDTIEDKQALFNFTTGKEVYTVPNEAVEYFLTDFIKNHKLTGSYVSSGCFQNITEPQGSFIIENSAFDQDFVFLYQKLPTSLLIHPFTLKNSEWTMSLPIQVRCQNDDELVISVLDQFSTTPDGKGTQHHVVKNPEIERLAYIHLHLFCFLSNQCYAATP